MRYNKPMPITADIRSIPRKLLDMILPPLCHICREGSTAESKSNICQPCLIDIEPMAGPLCGLCGRGFAGGDATEVTNRRLCGECIIQPPPFDRAISAIAYTGPIRKAIYRFKYNGDTRLAGTLASLMQTPLSALNYASIDIIMPIPLHRKRLTERGFNQSLLLAAALSKKTGSTVDYKSLRRVRHTTPQVELNARAREMNVKGAFELSGGLCLKDKTVLIVDDVYTTGSTIRECAKILKKEGARVIALTLARAV